jgi:hypothetical protein
MYIYKNKKNYLLVFECIIRPVVRTKFDFLVFITV